SVFDVPDRLLSQVRSTRVVVLVRVLQAGLVGQVGVGAGRAGQVGRPAVQVAELVCVTASGADQRLDVEQLHRRVLLRRTLYEAGGGPRGEAGHPLAVGQLVLHVA